MKPSFLLMGAATLVAVMSAGCEFDGGIARREKERPEAYASLHVWQKRFIEQGVIAKGFTPDMVYMAMGTASNSKTDGSRQLWTYKYYYPPGDLTHVRYHYYAEQALQDRHLVQGVLMQGMETLGHPTPVIANKGMVMPEAFKPGPPQGGSMEPADLQSYTIQVLFEGGKVTQIGVQENIN